MKHPQQQLYPIYETTGDSIRLAMFAFVNNAGEAQKVADQLKEIGMTCFVGQPAVAAGRA